MAAELASRYLNLDELAKASKEELQSISGIGPNIAEAVADWFSRPLNQRILNKLHRAGVWPQGQIKTAAGDNLKGLGFVITGTLPTFSRDEAKQLIESHGGKVLDAVSKKTDYLVLGENPGSKLEKARSLNIRIVDEEQLKKLIG